MDLRIKDKVYLVTGGGSGIGGGISVALARGGGVPVILGRRPKCGRSSRSCISSKSN